MSPELPQKSDHPENTQAANEEFQSLWVQRRLAEVEDDANDDVSYAERIFDLISNQELSNTVIGKLDMLLLKECINKQTDSDANRIPHLVNLRRILSNELTFRAWNPQLQPEK